MNAPLSPLQPDHLLRVHSELEHEISRRYWRLRAKIAVAARARLKPWRKPVIRQLRLWQTPVITIAEIFVSESRPHRIIRTVAMVFDIPVDAMMSWNHGPKLARPRQVAMALVREATGMSLPALGKIFHRDHTSLLHACRQTAARVACDTEFAAKVAAARAIIEESFTKERERERE